MFGHAAVLVSPQRTGKIKNSKYVYSFIGPLASSLYPRKSWIIKFGLIRLLCRSLPLPSILLCGFENEIRVTDCVGPAALYGDAKVGNSLECAEHVGPTVTAYHAPLAFSSRTSMLALQLSYRQR